MFTVGVERAHVARPTALEGHLPYVVAGLRVLYMLHERLQPFTSPGFYRRRARSAADVRQVDLNAACVIQGQGRVEGAAMASDAFFPFDDCVKIAQEAGIEAFIQPGGSVRDKDSVAYCQANGLAMVMTGLRHFKH